MKSRATFIRVSTFAAMLLALPWAGVANAQTVTVAGAMPGKLSVGATGQASYDIPIAVPPGIAGMQPNLSLHYGSGAGNGIAGMGWSISGLSAITRCTKTPAQDGQWGAVNYGADDRFCLGGKRLVAVNGVYGADGTEYRTEIDGFLKVVSHGKVTGSTGLQGASPLWFRVWTKSGRIMDFGVTADSRVERVQAVAPAPEKPVEVRAWSVSHVADAAGNYMTLTYFEDTVAGAHRIDRIDYSFNDAAAVTAQSSVRFFYEARPDGWQGFPNGSLTTLDVRLKAIQTYTDNALVRDYSLTYEIGGATGRSRLTGVTECDASGNCLAPHSSGWKPENAGFTMTSAYNLPSAVQSVFDGIFLDVNGDGRVDFVRARQKGSTTERNTWLNTDSGWVESEAYRPLFNMTEGKRKKGEFVDVNGDGLSDFVRAYMIDGISDRETWLNTGDGWQTSSIYQAPFDIGSYDTSTKKKLGHGDFVDLNGDGLTDFLMSYAADYGLSTETHYRDAWLNTGSGWQHAPAYQPPFTRHNYRGGIFGLLGELADINGDGLPDFIQAAVVNGVHLATAWLNTGNGWQESPEYQPPFVNGTYNWLVTPLAGRRREGSFVDVNGDGLTDFLQAYHIDSTSYLQAWVNTGAGWAASSEYQPPTPMYVYGNYAGNFGDGGREGRYVDVNGDGRPDFVRAVDIRGVIEQTTWLNTGVGWNESPAFKPPFLFGRIWTELVLKCTSGGSDRDCWYETELNAAYRGDFADIDSDGLGDFVQTPEAGDSAVRTTWLANSAQPDQLLSITDSLGAVSSIAYGSLVDPAIYEKHSDAVYPARDIQPRQHVVSEISRDDGVGGQYRVAYAYAGAKVDLTGRRLGQMNLPASRAGFVDLGSIDSGYDESPRVPDPGTPQTSHQGFLGFRYVSATDLQTGIVTTTARAQAFPYIGMVDSSASYIPDPSGLTSGTIINQTSNIFASRPLNGGANLFSYVEQSVTETFEPAHGHGNLPITTATRTGDYDDFGNPTQVTTTTAGGGQSFTTIAASTYTNDIANWFIGRLTRVEVTRTLPDLRSATRVASFDYDPTTGLLDQEVIEPDLPALTLATGYTRDAFGHIATATVSGPDIATRSATVGYPAAAPNYGRFPATFTNALGHAETRVFDARFGAPASLTGPNGIVTSWQYDGFGRPLKALYADGTETRWSYDLCVAQCPAGGVYMATMQNYVTATGLPTDARRVQYYDLLNRVFRGEAEGFDGTPVYADTVFNALGQVEKGSRPWFDGTATQDIQWTNATYDAVGRLKTVTAPDGGIETTDYNGLTVTGTNALNQSETRTIDASGQFVQATDATGGAIAYVYDPFGNLERTNAGGVVTDMTWDIRGRKLSMVDSDSGYWTYAYNALGELLSQTDAKLQTATMSYDLLGRVKTRNELEGTTFWDYDNPAKTAAIGKLDKVTRSQDDYVQEMFYDTLGRVAEQAITYEARDYVYGVTYDGAGRPETVTYPAAGDASRFAVENGYNALGYLETVREFGGAGTIYWQAMAVDAEGKVTEESLGNGVSTFRDFDPASGLIQNIRNFAGLSPLQDLGFEFDRIGNLTSRQDLLQNREEIFTYDTLNRLTSATVSDTLTFAQLGQTTASYDALGNLTFKSDVGGYVYGAAGAGPHAVTEAGDTTYGYDAKGSMISATVTLTGAVLRNVTWGSFGKPVRIEEADGALASEFVYGPDRARIKQTEYVGATPTKTVIYAGGGFERHIAPGAPDELVHYIGGAVAVFTKTDDANPATDKTRYLHKDHLGSVVMVTDEAGLVAETRSHDAWGGLRNADWTVPAVTPFLTETARGFTGHEHLQAVGLIHMNGRIYDPKIGRMLSADPFVQAPTSTQSFNRYSYVFNNPLSYTDPSGFCTAEGGGGGCDQHTHEPGGGGGFGCCSFERGGGPDSQDSGSGLGSRNYDGPDDGSSGPASGYNAGNSYAGLIDSTGSGLGMGGSGGDGSIIDNQTGELEIEERVKAALERLRKTEEFVEMEKALNFNIVIEPRHPHILGGESSWTDDPNTVHLQPRDLEGRSYKTQRPAGVDLLGEEEYFEIMDNHPRDYRYTPERIIFHEARHGMHPPDSVGSAVSGVEQRQVIEETNDFMEKYFDEPRRRNPQPRTQ